MWAERVVNCLRVPRGDGVDVLHIPGRDFGCFRGLQTCGSVWMCPVCAVKISERRRLDLELAIEAWRGKGGRVLMVTFTVQHYSVDRLVLSLDGLLAAREYLRSGKGGQQLRVRFPAVGTVRALEVTQGGQGWHPHLHELWFVPADFDVAGLRRELTSRWCARVLAVGLRPVNDHGVQIDDCDAHVADYVAKWGREPSWGPEHELAKQVVKSGRGRGSRSPTDLLAAYLMGDEPAGELWLEYARVFKGRRQLVWSRGLRALLGLGAEKSDEVLADEHDDQAVLLARLTLQEWRLVLANDARAEVLSIAGQGDREVLARFLEVLAGAHRSAPAAAD
jgi:hypothetical protein